MTLKAHRNRQPTVIFFRGRRRPTRRSPFAAPQLHRFSHHPGYISAAAPLDFQPRQVELSIPSCMIGNSLLPEAGPSLEASAPALALIYGPLAVYARSGEPQAAALDEEEEDEEGDLADDELDEDDEEDLEDEEDLGDQDDEDDLGDDDELDDQDEEAEE